MGELKRLTLTDISLPLDPPPPPPVTHQMYELYDECSLMFFYRNKHIMIDLGTGNNNKM